MTKAKWLVHWREERIKERNYLRSLPYVEIGNLSSFLKEMYDHIFTSKQDAFIRLTERYKSKLSKEYLEDAAKRIESWKPAARERSKEVFKSLVYSRNPFIEGFKDIPNGFNTGSYFPVPIIYKEKERAP